MKRVVTSRRFILGMVAIVGLVFLGYTKGIDVSLAIAGVVASVAGANAFQNKGTSNED